MFLVGELGARLALYGRERFERDLQSAGRSFTGLGDVGKKITDGIGRGLRAAASSTVVLGTATTALATTVFKGGLAYNQLQQTSRAALKTLLGSAEAVNAQMAQLDAFAKNSPFSKAVFIQAQQQLLGFGLEAQKVIPYLDAIQQAVAATGGSNDDINGLVEIIAKIRSSAKITAEDLNMFGGRGVDAATLIGSQMGKTGQEIREEITEGTLDANVALDSLAAAMQAKFGGATANVKSTISGTVDRIKAATREIGATMAEPFVSQAGGGLFVTWGNQVADVLRAVLGQTKPVVAIISERLAPAFAIITEQLDRAKVVVKSWDASTLETSLGQLGAYAPAVTGLAAGFGVLGVKGIPVVGALAGGLNPVVVGLVALAASSPQVRAAAMELFDTLSPLGPVLLDLGRVALTAVSEALPIVADGIQLVSSTLRPVVAFISTIPTPVLAVGAAFLVMRAAMVAVAGSAVAGLVVKGLRAVVAAIAAGRVAAMASGMGALGSSLAFAGGAATRLGTALRTAFLSNPVGVVITAAALAVAGLTAAFMANAEKLANQRELTQQLKETLNETTDAYSDLTRETIRKGLTDGVEGKFSGIAEQAEKLGISMETITDAAMGNVDAQASVTASLAKYRAGLGDGRNAQVDYNRAVLGFQDAIDFQRKALELAALEQRKYRQELQEANAALTDGERSNRRFNDALSIVRDTTKDAESRLKALKQALDELKGGSLSAADAQAKLSETNLNLADGLAQADEAGNKLWQGALDGAGKIDISNRAGLAFQDQMSRSADAMLTATQSAYDLAIAQGKTLPEATAAAAATGEEYNRTLTDTLRAAGLTEEQVFNLINTYGYLPSVVSTLVTDNGTMSLVDQQAISVISKLGTLGEGTSVPIADPNSAEVLQRLRDLGYEVSEPMDGYVTITQQGIEGIQAALAELTKPRTIDIQAIFRAPDAPAQGAAGDGLGVLKPNADGGIWRNAVRAFANGGVLPGVFAGREGGIHRFAEKETRNEAYISQKPGMEARNVHALGIAAGWFGMQLVPKDGARAFADGGIASLLSSVPGFAASEPTSGNGPSFSIPLTVPAGIDVQALADLIVARIKKLMRGR